MSTSTAPNIAECWDQRFRIYERAALAEMAALERSVVEKPWAELSGDERSRLCFALRAGVEFGRECMYALARSKVGALG